MNIMLDLVGSAIIFGILILTVARMQGNLNSTMYQNTFNLNTQTAAVNLARQVEHDFTKMGYRVTGQKILSADTNTVSFKGALSYGGTVETVTYSVGTADSASLNPSDYYMQRQTTAGLIKQRFGLILFNLSYFDTSGNKMTTPISGASAFAAIRAINVKFRLESWEPIRTLNDTTPYYYAVSWEKLIYPRNLGKPY
ncbi:MAG: hypothetical protein HY088_01800 [Ignavibacteriales bacterium]|nr:hypothetical protein [Ignavibacteriales bacterium]